MFELREGIGPYAPLDFVQTCRWENPDPFIESINCCLSSSCS
jgi:hypothetical protein